jgi:1-deoxy-D-xylulose-5-phosphate reductoisomerase
VKRQSVTILGATGSIGRSTLDVIARHPDLFSVCAVTAHSSVDELARLAHVHGARYAAISDPVHAPALERRLRELGSTAEVLAGEEGLVHVATLPETHCVMAAIVGAAGLPPTLAAAEAGKKILLANKEALVMAGPIFMDAVRRNGVTLLPIDSEHNAIFQCLPALGVGGLAERGIRRILLTGSGGPFRTRPREALRSVTPEEACAHPTWAMGPKISVDSATMMNKCLEVIEAHWLFDAPGERIEVVVHPQSVVHSMVEYVDGSVIAQLGNPDMRTPIAQALAYPDRIEAGVAPLDLTRIGWLDFEKPDCERFPALPLAFAALEQGGSAPAVLNAAN